MSTQSNNRAIDLAKKIKALAEQGIGGEKENAAEQLKRLLKKYNLTMEDIEGEKTHERWFAYKSVDQRKFISQVIASVIGGKRPRYSIKSLKEIGTDLTDAEFIEISEKIPFYWNHYQSELKTFYSAFIQVNKLYAKPDESDTDKEEKELSDEELEENKKLFQMMRGLNAKSLTKKLNA
jgi:hypothetical protein